MALEFLERRYFKDIVYFLKHLKTFGFKQTEVFQYDGLWISEIWRQLVIMDIILFCN